MQKTVLTRAVAVALATMGAGAAFAQSSLTLYGNIDVAVDNVRKSRGDISGTLYQTLPATAIATGTALGGATGAALIAAGNTAAAGYNASFLNKSSLNRITSSISSVNAIGVRGTEELGGGFKAGFVLEGQMQMDTGAQSGQDGRMWGRQAFASLTTPYGEVRLGRQYAPMFYSFAATTIESLGGADIQGSGLIVNNLQVRQDNQVSYWLKSGGLTAALSYSPQAGVDSRVSTSRVVNGSYTSTSGQILGGALSGSEGTDNEGRGRTYGLFLNYAIAPTFIVNGSYHVNKFGDAVLYNPIVDALDGAGGNGALFSLDKYSAYSIGTKYTIGGLGTQLSGIYHHGKFTMDGGDEVKVNTLALGVKHPINNFSVGAQAAVSKFANFTKGKDTSVMLIGDYNFSKRTRVYLRAGYVKDDRGRLADTETPFQLAGGPLPLLTGFGSVETPFFSAAGANIDGTTRVVAVGVRHQF